MDSEITEDNQMEADSPLHTQSWKEEFWLELIEKNVSKSGLRVLAYVSFNCDLKSGRSHWLDLDKLADWCQIHRRYVYNALQSLKDKGVGVDFENSKARITVPGIASSYELIQEVKAVATEMRKIRKELEKQKGEQKHLEVRLKICEKHGYMPTPRERDVIEVMDDDTFAEFIATSAIERRDKFEKLQVQKRAKLLV